MIRFCYDRKTAGVQCHCRGLYFVMRDGEQSNGYINAAMGRVKMQEDGSGVLVIDDAERVWVDIMSRCNMSSAFPLTIRRSDHNEDA